ncbi:MAG: DUF1232 domain-containing protein [Planctomycetota bacterium]|nr:MAG: DUF1232 domain-containing protein [Planctomycetota bacterium]
MSTSGGELPHLAGDFSEERLWEKLHRYAKTAGHEVVEKALWLYYAAQHRDTPAWAKGVIFGALVYFINPVDAVPDVIPAVGFSDDLGALALAVATVAMNITPEVKEQAGKKLRHWFD